MHLLRQEAQRGLRGGSRGDIDPGEVALRGQLIGFGQRVLQGTQVVVIGIGLKAAIIILALNLIEYAAEAAHELHYHNDNQTAVEGITPPLQSRSEMLEAARPFSELTDKEADEDKGAGQEEQEILSMQVKGVA